MGKKDEGTTEEETGTKLEFKKIDNYVAGVSGSGKRTKNNGDAIATALNGMTLEEVEQLATRMKVEHNDYTHLNVGMQRMNIGNAIRGAVNKAEKAEEGTGFALLESKAGSIIAKVLKRLAKATKDAETKAAAKADEAKKEAA